MPRFTLPGAEALSCADDDGRAFFFKFPYATDSPTEIRILEKHGAKASPAFKKAEPVKAPEKNVGGEV